MSSRLEQQHERGLGARVKGAGWPGAAALVLAAILAVQVGAPGHSHVAALGEFATALALAVFAAIALAGRQARRAAQAERAPLADLAQAVRDTAEGRLDGEIPHLGRPGEAGRMADAVAALRAAIRAEKAGRLAEAEARGRFEESRRTSEAAKAANLTGMAERVEQETGSAAAQMAGVLRSVTEQAREMARSAAAAEADSEVVARAAGQAMSGAQAVAAAADELEVAIRGISGQVEQARQATTDAVSATGAAEETLARLSQSVGQIGQVTGLIADIARQTNLLAINASVESARAGTAGQGFAVVAGEVKSLAEQTAQATSQIGDLIRGVQDVAGAAVEAVKRIGDRVAGIDEASASIAASVEQQSQATRDIAHSVAGASNAAQAVAAGIRDVSAEMRGAGERSRAVDALTAEVADGVETLRTTLIRVVRTSTQDVERRRAPRHAAELPGRVRGSRGEEAVEVADLSQGGAKLVGTRAGVGERFLLDLPDVIPGIACEVVAAGGEATHVSFRLSDAQAESLSVLLEGLGAEPERLRA